MGKKSNILIRLFKEVPQVAREPRFLEEDVSPRKSALRRWAELMWYAILDRRVLFEYNAFGCDRKGVKVSEMIRFWRDWKRWIVRANRQPKYSVEWTAPLNDKFLFAAYCEATGIAHVPVFARRNGDGVCTVKGARRSDLELLSYLQTLDSFVVKPSDEWGGHGVVVVRDPKSFSLSLLKAGKDYVFQPLVVQHREMAALNPKSVNTLRILTCRKGNSAESALLGCVVVRIGRASSEVDNVSSGGICCGCGADGRLTKIAVSQADGVHFKREQTHPDHGYSFGGQQIPFYKESVNLCLEAHRHFSSVRVIGWDIAVTPDGPVLIEGNSSPGVDLHQAVERKGLRPQLREICEL